MSDQTQLDALTRITSDINSMSDDIAAIKSALDSANAAGQGLPQDLVDAINAAASNADAAKASADQIALTSAPNSAPLPEPPAETGPDTGATDTGTATDTTTPAPQA